MSTLQATPSPLSPAPAPWTIFNRATSTPDSSSRPRVPAKIERRERVHYEAPEDLSGRVLCERYELTRRLGYGGMGEVYEARFLASGQRVAVKLLFARFADEPEMMTRFRHELQVLEAIEHPGIVRVRDFDQTSDRRPFLVMELIEGRDLRALLREQGKRPLAEVIELALQVCDALAILHKHGVIHRDLTPRNVIIDERSPMLRVKLIDFGISKLTSLFYAEERAYMTPPEQRLRTRTGRILGTPGYTAPEVADEPPSPQQDIFSLGVVLFELATGKRPPTSWLRVIPDDVDHEAYGLDWHTWMTLLKAIEPDPKIRYRSARDMSEALADLRLIVGDDDGGDADLGDDGDGDVGDDGDDGDGGDADGDSDGDDGNIGTRSRASARSEAVEHSPVSVASERDRRTAEPEGGATRSPVPTESDASPKPVPAEIPTESGASRSTVPTEVPIESGASPKLVPVEVPAGRDRGRSLWLAVLVLGLYATVDLVLHLRGYLADPPSFPAEISAVSERALAGDTGYGQGRGRDGAGEEVDANKVIAADEPTEQPKVNASSGLPAGDPKTEVGERVDADKAIAIEDPTEGSEGNASSGNPVVADLKSEAEKQEAKEVDQPAPTNTAAADAQADQADAKKATNTPGPRLSRASVLKVVQPKAKELALCLRSVGAETVDAKIDISEAGRIADIKLTPAVPYIVERCVVRILEPMTFASASRGSSHKLSLKDL